MGLARVDNTTENTTEEDQPLTHTGQVMGTLDFMSPEQTLDSRHVDGRTDIYSLGCTLYYLLTGQPPFGGDSMTKKMLAHRQEPIPSLRGARSDVPEALEEAFQKMLAKDPDQRQASMAEVIEQLTGVGAASQNVPAPSARRELASADTVGITANVAVHSVKADSCCQQPRQPGRSGSNGYPFSPGG